MKISGCLFDEEMISKVKTTEIKQTTVSFTGDIGNEENKEGEEESVEDDDVVVIGGVIVCCCCCCEFSSEVLLGVLLFCEEADSRFLVFDSDGNSCECCCCFSDVVIDEGEEDIWYSLLSRKERKMPEQMKRIANAV